MKDLSTLRRTALTAVLGAALVAAATDHAGAQVRDTTRADTTRADSVQTPAFAIGGVTVSVARPISTTGGASAVEMTLDSVTSQPAPTLEQVLREMPLIQIRTNSRGQAQPALRGAEDRQIAVLVDGVPLTLGWDARTDLSIVPLTAARSITLIRGLSSVLHGPNVLGGVVEIDVARGSRRQAPPEPLTVSASVDHTGGRAFGVTAGRLLEGDDGEWVFRGGAGHQARPGVALPGGLLDGTDQDPRLLTDDGELRLNSDVEQYDGFFSARYLAWDGAWASLSTSGFTTERGVPPEAHVDDPRLWRYPREDRLVSALTAGTGHRETALGQGDVEISLGMDLGRTYIDSYDSPAFDVIDGEESGDARTLTARLLADHTLGARGDLRTALTFADISHEETLGASEVNEYQQRLWSLGTEVEWRFDSFLGLPGLETTRLSFGAAVDGADTPETAGKPPLGTLWDWGGRVGFTASSRDAGFMVHGGLSRRSRFPALRELYSGALGRFEPNPELRPELMRAVELGTTLRGGGAELQTVVFHQRLTDGIVRSSVTVDGQSKFKRINRDEVRSTGLELLGSAEVGRRVLLRGDLTLQDVRGFTEGGQEVELEYEPTVAGKVGVDFALPREWTASTDLRFTSDQLCENPEAGGLEAFETEPHVDLGFGRRFSMGRGGTLQRIQAELLVDNVGDAAVFDQCGLPQPGRTFRLQFRLW